MSSGGTIVAEISTGDAVSGVVSDVTGGVMAQNKGNLVGQLYDVDSVAVSASPATVDEGMTRQMDVMVTMDDATLLGVDASDVSWSETGAFLSGVDANGLVSANLVYQNEAGQNVGGSYVGIVDADGFDLTVVNVGVDDFGTYAGDGLDDDWQVGFFGTPPNANAAPGVNPDGDTSSNLTEFLGGFDPTDLDSFLQFTVTGKTGTTVDFELNKAIPGRTYRLMESGDLATPFTEVGNFTVPGVEAPKAVQDTGAPVGMNYYRIEISKP